MKAGYERLIEELKKDKAETQEYQEKIKRLLSLELFELNVDELEEFKEELQKIIDQEPTRQQEIEAKLDELEDELNGRQGFSIAD